MKDAVIVSTARTPIGVAFKGSLNAIKSPTMMGHAIKHAVERAGIDGAEIDDVVLGSVLIAGTAGMNVARLSSIAAGLPVSVPAQTIDRQCSSGLMAIATAALRAGLSLSLRSRRNQRIVVMLLHHHAQYRSTCVKID